MRQRRALTLAPYTGTAQELLETASRAEQDGYDDLWFADTGAPDALTLAAAVAVRTQRVRIGIAVVPIYTRTPAVLAASAATLDALAPGRFVLGLGTSSDNIVDRWHGLPREQPLVRMRETVHLLRSMFTGEKSDFEGETVRSHGYRQPALQVPLYIAALRPEMLELAAEIGDGVVLNLFPRQALPKIMEHIAIGARRGGKSPEEVEVLCRYQVAVSDRPQDYLEGVRHFLSSYFAVQVYNRYLAWCGYPEAAAEIAAGWAAKDRERTAAALPDALLQDIAIVGDRDYCVETIRACARGGIHTHIITCLSPEPAQQNPTWQAFAADIFADSD